MTVNQEFLTNLYSGVIKTYILGAHKNLMAITFFPSCQFADVLMKR